MNNSKKIRKLLKKGYEQIGGRNNIFINREKKKCYIFKTQVKKTNKNEHNCLNLIEYTFNIIKDYKIILYVDTKTSKEDTTNMIYKYSVNFTGRKSVRSYSCPTTRYSYDFPKEEIGVYQYRYYTNTKIEKVKILETKQVNNINYSKDYLVG